MNIIIINDYAFVNGGAGNVAISMAELLAGHGNNVILFSAVGPIDKRLENILNLKVVCLYQEDILNSKNRLSAIINGLWNRRAAKALDELLGNYETRDTIVHIHTLSKALSTSIIPVVKKHNMKVIYQMHDYGIACPNMGFFDYKKNTKCKRKAMSLKCVSRNCDKRSYFQKCWRVLRQFIQIYIGGLPRNIDCIIGVSNFSINVLKPYIKQRQLLEILPNIINVPQNERVRVEENDYYIFIGRLMPEKNPIILAKAGAEIDKKVIFVGDGNETKAIKKENNQAVVIGWVDSKEIKKYLLMARALVFPSKCYECHPLTIMEALAYGIPVITSDECAAIEEVTDGYNGRWFKNDDLQSLCCVMKEFSDDDMVKEYSKNAYTRYWTEAVNLDDYYKKLMNIYNRLLG